LAGEVINARYEVIEPIPTPDNEPLHEAKVRDMVEGRVVTLSVLSLENLQNPINDRAAFFAGAEQAAQILDPNLIRIYDRGEVLDSGDPFVVCEYLRGITLSERIRRIAPFSLSVAVDIAVGYVGGLNALHGAGLIHGDLRPHNVLLSAEGQVKIAGVGYSRAARTALGLYSLAKPYYPNLDAGDATTITPADDLYAAGVILYEMLTGALPDPRSLLVSVRSINPGVPPALDGVIAKALDPEIWKRYQRASDLLTDLTSVRDALKSGRSLTWSPSQETVPARPKPPRGQRPGRPSDMEEPPTVRQVPITQSNTPAVLPVSGPMGGSASARPPQNPIEEDEDDLADYKREDKDPPSILGTVFKVLFVLTIVAVIGAVWYVGKIFAVPDDIVIPNLVGKTYDDAQRISQEDHFNLVESGSDYSTKWPEDQIYSQDPPSGRTVKAGHDVDVMKSLGPRTLTVPNIVGMTVDRATQALQDAQLPAGTETDNYNDTVAQGVVVSQNPLPSTSVARDTAVDYVVSKGKQPPDVPQNVQTDTTDPNSVHVTWNAASRADSYSVSRVEDSGTTVVGQGIKGTQFTDKGLTPNTSYAYAVEAINTVGSSGLSDTVPIVTPSQVDAPPEIGNNIQVTPPSTDGTTTGDATSDSTSDEPAKMRQFVIKFRVPWHPTGTRRVQFEVQDATGSTMMYDETHAPGDTIEEPITAFGNKVTMRIFVDGKLVKQQTR